MKAFCIVALWLFFSSAFAAAQETIDKNSTTDVSGMDTSQMPGMKMGSGERMNMQTVALVQEILAHDTSGTSTEPDSTPAPMRMPTAHAWTLMFHAHVFVLDERQSSARGSDKFFSTNCFMGMAQHDAGPGKFTMRATLTPQPATITGDHSPLRFRRGETAYGVPIADGQHPHNFVMELAALYDRKLGNNALFSFSVAPTGDPALGPTAYPHRASAAEDPVAPL